MLPLVRFPALLPLLLVAAAASGSAGCASEVDSGDGSDNAGSAATVKVTGSYHVKLTSDDSAGAKAFLSAFVPTFQSLAIQEFKDQASGASTRTELEGKIPIYKVQRNDGKIVCTIDGADEMCEFTFPRTEVDNGNAISRGDRNDWAGQLASSFASRFVVVASDGSPAGSTGPMIIGDKKTGIYIACGDGPADRGLATSVCTFRLTKPAKSS